MSECLQVGIIGCGGISAMHASNYDSCADTVIVAAADLSKTALEGFSEKHPAVHTYLSYEEMLANERLDIVSVCTPPLSHVPPALAVARSGVKGMMLEKPMALNLKDADAIVAACGEHSVKLSIGHQLRYSACYRTARRLIEDGAIGVIDRLWGICHNAPLQTNATHTIDLLRFLTGDAPVDWVMGSVDTSSEALFEGFRQEAVGLGLFQLREGPPCVIESGHVKPYRGYHHIYIDGSDGQIELSRDGAPPVRFRSGATNGLWHEPHLADEINPIDDLVSSIRNGTETCSSGRQGRTTLELILALFESARTHRMVTLPLESRENPLVQIFNAEA